ncbi:hypothetical protein BT96DRAFT_863671 [Gymnopus androsaceus JB14]|uniref:NACHT domain-containing protein n=1 Tax=Gymnopus androsaceus JB14 TaxID=1447944 RepID=A0A6A4H4R1_9AGAR|nr:hypothetical protein BT96DRAFT_863671 [Gymnopus androsaceus JB14]
MKKRVQSLKLKIKLGDSSTSKPKGMSRQSSQILSSTLNAAETSIRLLKQLSDSIPFIGNAASATIFIIDQCKKYLHNAKDFEDLLKSLQGLQDGMSPYKDRSVVLPSEVMKQIEKFDSAISNIRGELISLQSSSRISQFVNNSENERRITALVQKVKNAVDKIMLASLLDISREVHNVSRGVEKAARDVQEIVLAQALLSLNPVHGARYNCVDRDQCLDGTRVTVLDDIQNWFDSGEGQIYWLNGAAGMGKTTIALSVARRLLSNSQSLMATFFCSRDSVDRKNSGLIFPTLACQLASCNKDFHDGLVDILGRYPYIGAALPHEQVQRLIVEPLQKIKPPPTVALVLDALDECNGERASEKILLALLQHVRSIPLLKVFISCRPAAYVEELLSSGEHRRMFKLHHVPASIVDNDLRLFYNQQLEDIRTAKKLGTEDWPPVELVEKLVQQAAGLFIFAVTVCKYVSSRGDAKRRLEHIANISKGDYEDALSVDMLYTEVLSAAIEKIPDKHDRRNFARVLMSVMLVQEPLTVDAFGQLLNIDSLVIYDLLRDVHSILSVPDEVGTLAGEVVHIFHASFADYITAHDQVGNQVPLVYIDPKVHHLELAHLCLQCMNRDLKRILPFSKRSFANSEIQDLDILVKTHISRALHYAALYWADHLSAVTSVRHSGHPILEELQQFANTKLLFWLECISLLNASESAIESLVKGKDWLKKMNNDLCTHTLQLLDDGYHAVNEFYPIVQNFGVHIYLSFILFLPQGTALYRCYSHFLPPHWKVMNPHKTWNPLIGSPLPAFFSSSFTFSPDSRRIAFVSNSIFSIDILSSKQHCITEDLQPNLDAWNAEKIPGVDASFPALNYSILQPSLTSVIWLPSGVIATCCTILSAVQKPYKSHCYVSLWDSETGAHIKLLYHTFEETNMFLPIMTASPSFRYLGLSIPSTQIFWDAQSWDQICSSPSRTPFYRCFAVSDDHYLIGTELWRISEKNQVLLDTLGIDQQHVTSSVFSHDGRMIVLGLTNGLVELWQVLSGSKALKSFQISSGFPEENIATVCPLPSVAFSPGSALVAVSFGSLVSLLKLEANDLIFIGELATPTYYHPQLIHVSFSPGGQYIVCSDKCGMIRIWSTAAAVNHCINSHSNQLSPIGPLVDCIAYMTDGHFCVTGNYNGILSIQDCSTGLPVHTWQSEHDVSSVAVSSDGRFVASSGSESTCIWSISEGSQTAEVTIPAPPDTIDYSSNSAVTFNAGSTMLAILTAFVVDIWELTEAGGWQRYTQIRTSNTEFSFIGNETYADNFDDSSFKIRALYLNYRWLAHIYHKLPVRSPFHWSDKDFEPRVTDAEYEQILLECRSAFEWWKSPKKVIEEATYTHSQLYFSLTDEYILAPSGIYEIATRKEIKNYEKKYLPWQDSDIARLERKYFWSDHKEYYKRNGALKSLHPMPEQNGWIADMDGQRLFWLPRSYHLGTKWPSWSSYASAGDNFAFISASHNLIMVHVSNTDSSKPDK